MALVGDNMINLPLTYRVLVILLLLILFDRFLDVNNVYAHSPHDVIDAIEISSTCDETSILFIIVKNKFLLKSLDGGFSWKKLVKGIDNKQLLSSVAVSPYFHLDSTVFLSTKGDGIYKSINGGLSWFKVNNGLNNLSISFISPSFNFKYDKVILAAGSDGRLYKTKNGGDVWYQVIDESVKLTSIAFIPDSENNSIIVGDIHGIIHVSYDIGEKWQRLFHLQNCGAITSIAVSPDFSSDRTFFVGTQRNGVYKTIDGGVSFEVVNNRILDLNITDILLSPEFGKDSTIYASTWNDAVFISNDGGNTWKIHNKGLTKSNQADSKKHLSPHFRNLRVSNKFSADGEIFLGGFDGLFKSTNGGDCWMQLETRPLKIIKGLGVSPANNNNYTIAITTYGGGAYISEDEGATWLIGNMGLKTTRLSDVAFSPDYHLDDNVFSASIRSFLKSNNDGGSWANVRLHDRIKVKFLNEKNYIAGILSKFVGESWAIRIHDKLLGKPEMKAIWPTFIAVSPVFASDNTIYFGTRNHGIFKSSDAGETFSQIWDEGKGKGEGKKITSLIISPDFLFDRTLYASVRNEGVYKTTDGGDTWQLKNNGLLFKKDIKLLIKPDYKLSISPDYKKDNTVFVGIGSGLFKTSNGGENWEDLGISDCCGSGNIMNVATSPDYGNDNTVIVSIKGKGLFKSEDDELTWIDIGTGLINNYVPHLIEFSPLYSTDNTIYVATEEEFFKSKNNGNTWEVIKRPVRYENIRGVVHYEGEWQVLRGNDYSAMSISYSESEYSNIHLNFVGTGISWIGSKSNKQGIANVYIDDELEGTVDQFSNKREVLVQSFSITDLAYGAHTITIEVTKNKNLKSLGNTIEIDAFDILP